MTITLPSSVAPEAAIRLVHAKAVGAVKLAMKASEKDSSLFI